MEFAPDSSFPLTYDKKELFQFKLHGIGSEQLALDIGCQTVSRFVPFPRKRANRTPSKWICYLRWSLSCYGYLCWSCLSISDPRDLLNSVPHHGGVLEVLLTPAYNKSQEKNLLILFENLFKPRQLYLAVLKYSLQLAS